MPIDQGEQPTTADPGARSGRWFLFLVCGSFALIALFAAGTLWLLSREFQTIASEREAVTQGRQLIEELDSILMWLRDAQAAKRAFIETGNADFLALYDDAKRVLPQKLQYLDELSRGTSAQKWEQGLARQVDSQLDLIDATIALYRQDGSRTPAVQRMLDSAKQNIIETQDAIQQRRSQEKGFLDERIRRGDSELVRARRVSINALLAACACIMFVSAWMLRHIRRREQVEQQFKQSSTLWRATIDSIDQGVAVYDGELRLLDWNRRYCELRGVSPEQLFVGASIEHIHKVGMPNMTGTEQDSAERQAERLRNVVEYSRTDIREWKRTDGVSVHASSRPMAGGMSVVTLTDISVLRASEAAVRDQAVRLAAIFDNVLDAIITFNESGSIESWSRGAERMFGYGSADVLQRDIASLVSEPHEGDLQRYFGSRESLTVGKRLEWEAQRKDGGRFAIDLCVSEMYLGRRRLFVCVMRDISERRELERMKAEFVSTVSHELRTPLTSIAGALGLVTAGVTGTLPDKAARLLSIAQRNSERLTLLINDILDLEKAEAGKLALQLRVQALHPIVEQAIEANRVFAESLSVRFELVAADNSGKVCVDAERLVQVLTNLLSNAVKFSPPHAVVRVLLEPVGSMWRTAVHDDGPGITESFRGKIFARFEQDDTFDARRLGGTGLGLAIAKSLTEKQGGRIGFTSGQSAVGKGQGATFWVDFPFAVDADSFSPPEETAIAPMLPAGQSVLA